jgi:hypothetical protein
MENDTRKYAAKTRGRPFAPGNAGRPRGSRNRTTLAAEDLLDSEAEKLTRKAIDLALAGDVLALRLCLERLLPPRRERRVALDLSVLRSGADVPAGISLIVAALAAGKISLPEADASIKLLETITRCLDEAKQRERVASAFPGLSL